MPIYEFECRHCGHVFDRLQKLSDPDPETCPDCATTGVRRRVTAPSFRLAGSGWYETDFKKDGDKKRNLAGGDDKSASAGSDSKPKDGKSADSKPATDGKAASKASSDSKASAGSATSN
ncbi:MAG: zinc ribbon domain-containing protein [Xanthomonadales bacterium]|nr:zinc ribbon domain-containing protein [Xanthomonadales bacterium]